MTGLDTPLRVNAQAGTLAVPRLVRTSRVVGLAAVTASGVVAQPGHCLLPVSPLKARASLSTGTFRVEPSGQVTTPAGAPVGGDPVKTRSPLMKASLAASDGKPPLGPEVSSSAVSTTRPVRQALASGERAQALASWRAREVNGAPSPPSGGGDPDGVECWGPCSPPAGATTSYWGGRAPAAAVPA